MPSSMTAALAVKGQFDDRICAVQRADEVKVTVSSSGAEMPALVVESGVSGIAQERLERDPGLAAQRR
jgi:hypothetical protein